VEKPAPGQLDLRDLPCLVQLLREHALEPDVIVIGGSVHLDAAETPGLGQRLYEALAGRTAIVGVSTRSMPGMPAQFEVFREEEARPVIVTCAGIDLGAAKIRVRARHGKRRVPTLLKLVSRIARGGPV
jgi:deoxyribonuclease V